MRRWRRKERERGYKVERERIQRMKECVSEETGKEREIKVTER